MLGRQEDKNLDWERKTVEKLALASVEEQRRARRWGIVFKSLTFVYLFALLFMFRMDLGQADSSSGEEHTALVEINGVIADNTDASADKVVTALRKAFDNADNIKGILLRINSPGGSPVQSAYIYDEIIRLREKHPDTPVYAVVSDICASGGYYIAAAAEKIYVNRSSIVGSIGVLMNGFGFTEAMEKLGVERRLLTAGEHKGMLDPFSPLKEEELAHADILLKQIHSQFIDSVKAGRGERLKDDPTIFSGMFWTGAQAVELGLADDFGSSGQVARDVFEAEKIVRYNARKPLLERLSLIHI